MDGRTKKERNNMVEYDIKDVQSRIIRILNVVDGVCREHGLTYYLWAGTMLGAVRHKGFIPWDDDADIAMPREDYEKLISHPEWMPEPFEFICAENDRDYPLPFAKIQDASTTIIERMHLKYLGGIYIDVFPLDGVPAGKLARRCHFARYQFYKKVLYYIYRDPYKHGRGPSSWIPLLCRRLFTQDGVQKSIRKIMMKYGYDSSEHVADYDDGMRGITDKDVIGKPAPYMFDGHELLGVERYDAYLSNKYGDYMTIPKASDRHQHKFHFVDLDHSYREHEDMMGQ